MCVSVFVRVCARACVCLFVFGHFLCVHVSVCALCIIWCVHYLHILFLQDSLPGQIHVVYIIQQGQFWHRRQSSFSRHSREKARFEFSVRHRTNTHTPCMFIILSCLQTITLSSMDKLLRHIEESQLTSDLGGFLPYNHKEWITFRLVSEITPTQPHIMLHCLLVINLVNTLNTY